MSSIHCEKQDLSSRTGVQFYLGERIGKIEHEENDTCDETEMSQDADNAVGKVKRHPKVHKTYKLLWDA